MDYSRAFQYAINSLSRRAQLTADLRKKLKLKGAIEEDIERIIVECQRLQFLNDEAYIESYVKGMLSKKMGPQRILARLYQKGISPNITKRFLDQLDTEAFQKARIKSLLSTRYKSKNLEDFKERQKVIAALIRKGFAFEIITNILSS